MKKLKCYYLYLISVIVITTLLVASLIIAMCLKHLELIQLFLSLVVFDICLWLIAIVKRPSLDYIIKILEEEYNRLHPEKAELWQRIGEVNQRVDEAKAMSDELLAQYRKHVDVLQEEENKAK